MPEVSRNVPDSGRPQVPVQEVLRYLKCNCAPGALAFFLIAGPNETLIGKCVACGNEIVRTEPLVWLWPEGCVDVPERVPETLHEGSLPASGESPPRSRTPLREGERG